MEFKVREEVTVKTLLKYLDLYISFIKNCLVREMQFRGNYLLMVITTAFLNVYFLIYYMVLIERVGNNFLGWNQYQLLFFLSTEVICHSLFMAFCFYNVFSLPEQIRTGSLDFLLLKPVSTRFLLSTRYFNFATFTQSLLGLCLGIYAFSHLDIKITFGKVILYVLLIINSVFIMYLISFLIMILAFFFVKISASGSILPYRGFFSLYWFARRPEEIYTNLMIMVMTYAIPLLLIINLPAKWMVKSVDGSLVLYTFVFSSLFFAFTQWLWRIGLKRYQSASS